MSRFAVRKELAVTSLLKMAHTSFEVDISSMRAESKRKRYDFTEDRLISKEPFEQFKDWFEEACNTTSIVKPNAMCLATCTKDGFPSARFVLLKGFGSNGFKFYTNYKGRKGTEITENPNVAAVLYWEPLGRSVRIEGTVRKLSEEESTKYFQSRPKESQLGAASSNQSRQVASRQVLRERKDKLKELYKNSDVLPRPDEWGGFIIKPHTVEFWQGQTDCLHDRIRFRIPKKNEVVDNILLHEGKDGWVYERLQP